MREVRSRRPCKAVQLYETLRFVHCHKLASAISKIFVPRILCLPGSGNVLIEVTQAFYHGFPLSPTFGMNGVYCAFQRLYEVRKMAADATCTCSSQRALEPNCRSADRTSLPLTKNFKTLFAVSLVRHIFYGHPEF